MLLSAAQCHLLVVGVQERLMPAMTEGDKALANIRRLVLAAHRLEIPVSASEQYPKGIGPTVASVRDALGEAALVFPKLTFSCARDDALASRLAAVRTSGRDTVVVCGVEAHVCVLQTAMDLQAAGYRVAVVADATASRDPASKERALARLASAGVAIVDTEMVLFECLERAGTPAFKAVLALIK